MDPLSSDLQYSIFFRNDKLYKNISMKRKIRIKIENSEKVKRHWANKLYKNHDRLFPDETNPLSSNL